MYTAEIGKYYKSGLDPPPPKVQLLNMYQSTIQITTNYSEFFSYFILNIHMVIIFRSGFSKHKFIDI